MISLSDNSSELAVSSSLKDLSLLVCPPPPLDVPLRRLPLGEDDPVCREDGGVCVSVNKMELVSNINRCA